MDQLIPVTIKLTPDIRRFLRLAAAQDDESQSDVIAKLLAREKAKREKAATR